MGVDFSLLMREALAEARKGFEEGEIPVGALLVDPSGKVLAKAHNRPVALNDPTAHAELLALRDGASVSGNYRIGGATLVVTIEPCLMCMGAALNARISHLVFGAFDPKWGAAGSLYDIPKDGRMNHRIEVTSRILEEECMELMQSFFRLRRREKASGEVPKWS